MADNVIKEGDTVIFDTNGEKQSFIRVKGKAKLKFGNAYCPAEALIGCPYGSMFVLGADGKSLERTKYIPSSDWDPPAEVTKDNSRIVDTNKDNQKLTQDEILEMKRSGAAGEDIIDALTSNSVTFHSKTEFSQEKYKKRKAKKYILVGCVRRPTAALVCAAYFNKHPSKIGNLRPDILALMLHMGNACANGRMLVVESCGGMIVGAVAERMGGYGTICNAYVGSTHPGSEIVGCFNFDDKVKESIYTVPLLSLLEHCKSRREGAVNGNVDESEAVATARQDEAAADGTGEVAAAPEDVAVEQDGGPQEVEMKDAATVAPAIDAEPLNGAAADGSPVGIPVLSDAVKGAFPFTSCILALPSVSPSELVFAVLPLLAPSASFVVFSHWAQPLAECMDVLRSESLAVGLSLQEAWMREHQVLPMRTHPMNNMNHGGGYLLSGIVTLTGTQGPLAQPADRPVDAGR